MTASSTQAGNFDSTIAALQQGLASIPPEQAISVIDSWQQQLQGYDISEDLGELKAALTNGSGKSSKGQSIAEILTDLGEDTNELAADADGTAATKAKQLAELLIQAGKSIQ